MDIMITPRLTIRPPLEVDADALVDHLNDPRVTCNLASLPKPYRVEDAHQFLTSMNETEQNRGYVIVRERAIGMIGLHDHAADAKVADLGYWLAARHQGKGLMGEALQKVIDQLFEEDWVSSLKSQIIAGNNASERLQEKLGFKVIGEEEKNGKRLMKTSLAAGDFRPIH